MIWYKYQTHDYMDEKPSIGYHLFENEESALKWEQHMNTNYSGGITTILGPATQAEILEYVRTNKLDLDDLTISNINNINYYKNETVKH